MAQGIEQPARPLPDVPEVGLLTIPVGLDLALQGAGLLEQVGVLPPQPIHAVQERRAGGVDLGQQTVWAVGRANVFRQAVRHGAQLLDDVSHLSVGLCQIVLAVGDADKMSCVQLAPTRGPDAKPAPFEQEAVRKSLCLRDMGFGFHCKRLGKRPRHSACDREWQPGGRNSSRSHQRIGGAGPRPASGGRRRLAGRTPVWFSEGGSPCSA
jgi:hypothetical protein